jgi:hypothetical protein
VYLVGPITLGNLTTTYRVTAIYSKSGKNRGLLREDLRHLLRAWPAQLSIYEDQTEKYYKLTVQLNVN